ncbi:PBPRA1643 family SWIM/SEC-C metal-binding motif protein [Marinobacter alexandrii]|uniref:PBPRA1643 family SWIM/SEC-C metal-binding motif protein n=1 Tax=Marinobacter alexandrii TaxID=2570351 RepID=UPI001108C7D6|nr:PBPRA1643 family SWIM/SEC-C metal-binding motif protein [Marinobacter alexandrii]
MSDKFFYKGRQDARQHHTTYGGFQTNASQRSGTRKFPLSLVVTNEARKQEIEAQVAEAGLYAEVALDTCEGATESISELTVILNKGSTVTAEKLPSRNDPCTCGSGLKFKKCCG